MVVALLLGLGCGFFGSIPIAGPTAVLVLERGMAGHAREAFGIAVGSAVAETGYALLAFLGMTAALSEFPWLVPASRIVGALILLGLGLYFALAPRHKAGGPHTPRSDHGSIFLGLFVTGINPTLLVTWSAVVTILHSTGWLRVVPLDAFPFGLGVGAGVAGWFATMLVLLRKLRKKLKDQTMDRLVRGLGWVLVVGGVALLVNLVVRAFA